MTPSKAKLREHALRALQISPTTPAESLTIAGRIAALDSFRSARTVALYAALRGEPDLATLWQHAADKQIVCASGPRETPELRVVADPAAMVRTPRGFSEPPAGPAVDPATVDLWIIPGLTFDLFGFRLGRGAGYYDRLLARRGRDSLAIGVVPQRWLSAQGLPREVHDVPVDAIVTESAFHVCGAQS